MFKIVSLSLLLLRSNETKTMSSARAGHERAHANAQQDGAAAERGRTEKLPRGEKCLAKRASVGIVARAWKAPHPPFPE